MIAGTPRKAWSPKDVQVLVNPKTCEWITTHGKGDFANMILRWGDIAELLGWAQCNHKSPDKREARGSESKKEM